MNLTIFWRREEPTGVTLIQFGKFLKGQFSSISAERIDTPLSTEVVTACDNQSFDAVAFEYTHPALVRHYLDKGNRVFIYTLAGGELNYLTEMRQEGEKLVQNMLIPSE